MVQPRVALVSVTSLTVRAEGVAQGCSSVVTVVRTQSLVSEEEQTVRTPMV